MNLAEIIEYINKNVTSPSQLEGMRGMGLSIEPLPESYKAKRQRTDSGIDYYICNRNAETRNKLVAKLEEKIGTVSSNSAVSVGSVENEPFADNNKKTEDDLFFDFFKNEEVEEKKCKACGATLGKEAMFCHMCGAKYEEVKKEEEIDWGFTSSSAPDVNEDVHSDKPDLVAENAMLTPCPETECTHGREYYKTSQDLRFKKHCKATLFNKRLYYIKMNVGRATNSIWCSKEDGQEKHCLIEQFDIGDDRAADFYIVVNYHGIFIYNLNRWFNPEWGGKSSISETRVLWYDFSGTLKGKYVLADKQTLIDVYIYGTKIFYVSYAEGSQRKYYAKMWDVMTNLTKNISAMEGKAICEIMGNNDFILFYMDKEDKVFTNNSEDVSYDKNSGWCIAWQTDQTCKFLKTVFYPTDINIDDIYDEKMLPQIEFFDLKKNLIWVDNRNVENDQYTISINERTCREVFTKRLALSSFEKRTF